MNNKDKQEKIIEIFGKRLKVVNDGKKISDCKKCALYKECSYCNTRFAICANFQIPMKGVKIYIENRHFVEVDEDGNEIGGDK